MHKNTNKTKIPKSKNDKHKDSYVWTNDKVELLSEYWTQNAQVCEEWWLHNQYNTYHILSSLHKSAIIKKKKAKLNCKHFIKEKKLRTMKQQPDQQPW